MSPSPAVDTEANSATTDLSIVPYLVDRAIRDLHEPHLAAVRQPVMLVIEDDDIDAEVLLRLIARLPDRDWKVLRARSLAEALQIVKFEEPDVALVDLNLADAWHSDAVQALVEAVPECPVIVQTGLDDQDVPAEMLRMGAQDFLHKDSITVEVLSRSIRYALARHQTHSELRRTWTRLSVANAELDDFAHIVAHDLRAPTRTAKMLTTRLIQELPENSSELAIELSSRLEQALGSMDDMILSMLDYAGLRSDNQRPSDVLVVDSVNTALATLQADLEEIGGTVEVDLDDSLTVVANDQLLQRVVNNIVSNAIKYRENSRPTRIRISAEHDADCVELKFWDNGVGVPNAERERVFGVLERLAHRDIKGLGFGLAICRRIVDGFGGQIWIEPALANQGCTVVTRIPTPPPAVRPGTVIHLD